MHHKEPLESCEQKFFAQLVRNAFEGDMHACLITSICAVITSWQEELGSSLLSVMDRLALEIIPEDATFMTDNISKFHIQGWKLQ